MKARQGFSKFDVISPTIDMLMEYDKTITGNRDFAVKFHLIDLRQIQLTQQLMRALNDERSTTWEYQSPQHEEGFNILELNELLSVVN